MLDFILKLGCHFTDAEKEECKNAVYRIMDLAFIARAEGILHLEIEMSDDKDFFLKTAIGLVVDGTDPVLVKQILQHIIIADANKGAKLLHRLIIAEGILSIQQGENPRIIMLKLSAMLGEAYMVQIEREYEKRGEKIPNIYGFLKGIKNKQSLAESKKFEDLIFKLHGRDIQLVLQGIEYRDLISALKGCGAEVIEKIFANASTNTCLNIINDLERADPYSKDHMIRSQARIISYVEELKKSGEIIIIYSNIESD